MATIKLDLYSSSVELGFNFNQKYFNNTTVAFLNDYKNIKGRIASVITNLLEDGVPLEEVRSFIGHSHVDTTARYNQGIKDLAKSPAFKISL